MEGGFLGWEFFTESYDIKFGVYRFEPGTYQQGVSVLSSGDVVKETSKSESKGDVQVGVVWLWERRRDGEGARARAGVSRCVRRMVMVSLLCACL